MQIDNGLYFVLFQGAGLENIRTDRVSFSTSSLLWHLSSGSTQNCSKDISLVFPFFEYGLQVCHSIGFVFVGIAGFAM